MPQSQPSDEDVRFKEGRSGYAFKDGRLYALREQGILVMTPWPDPQAWFQNRPDDSDTANAEADQLFSSGGFQMATEKGKAPRTEYSSLPSGQCLLPGVLFPENEFNREITQIEREILDRYAETIPPHIRDELSKFTYGKWHVFRLLAVSPGALDLCRSNPALFFVLAYYRNVRDITDETRDQDVSSLVYRKQRDILKWLGFPATEAVRRILSKFTHGAIRFIDPFALRDFLGDSVVVKYLSHLEHINNAVMLMVTDSECLDHLTPRLLRDIAQNDEYDCPYPMPYSILTDTIRMAEMVEWKHCPKRFVSLARLIAVHDELVRRLDWKARLDEYDIPSRFAEPQFPGTEHIQPITTPDGLFIEGHNMKSCVGFHSLDVVQGSEYVYRVLSPVRATMSIHYEQGEWCAGSLFRACNEPVDEDIRTVLFGELFNSGRNNSRDSRKPIGAYDNMLYPPIRPAGDLRQLPLLSPDKMKIYWDCVEAFAMDVK